MRNWIEGSKEGAKKRHVNEEVKNEAGEKSVVLNSCSLKGERLKSNNRHIGKNRLYKVEIEYSLQK